MKIKNWVFSILFCFIISFAQSKAHAFEFGVGPKVGVGISFYTGTQWYNFLDRYNLDNRPVVAFSLGIIFDMNFIKKGGFGFGIQPEVLYTYAGGGFTDDTYDYDEDYIEEYYHTVQIPIFLKMLFGAGKGYFFILAGPDIMISIDQRLRVSHNGGEGLLGDFTKNLDNKYSVGMSCGIGFDFVSGGGKFELSLTYSTYFTGLGNDNIFYNDTYINMLYVNAAYSFTIIGSSN